MPKSQVNLVACADPTDARQAAFLERCALAHVLSPTEMHITFSVPSAIGIFMQNQIV